MAQCLLPTFLIVGSSRLGRLQGRCRWPLQSSLKILRWVVRYRVVSIVWLPPWPPPPLSSSFVALRQFCCLAASSSFVLVAVVARGGACCWCPLQENGGLVGKRLTTCLIERRGDGWGRPIKLNYNITQSLIIQMCVTGWTLPVSVSVRLTRWGAHVCSCVSALARSIWLRESKNLSVLTAING